MGFIIKIQKLTIPVLFCLICCSVFASDPPTPVNYPIGTPFPELQNEEQMWVSPVDSNIVLSVWRDFRLGYRQVGIGRSTDGGQTWTDSLISIIKYQWQSDPCIDVDRLGNFYICVMDYESSLDNSSLQFFKSTDNGLSWTEQGAIDANPGDTPSLQTLDDKQFITIDRTSGAHDGNVYVAWVRFSDQLSTTRILFSRSTDGAANFPDTLVVGPVPDFSSCGISNWSSSGTFAQPLVGADGSVYVFWIGYDTVDCVIKNATKMIKSTDGGASFGSEETILYPYGNRNNVDGSIPVYNATAGSVDISGGVYDGNIYLSYGSIDTANTAFNDWNIYFIKSSDGGDNWTEPIIINDDYAGLGAKYDQFHPWLYCNQEGTIVSIFYDQRMDVVNHYMFDLFAAYSFDGGQTFTSNHRISNVSSNPGLLNAATIANSVGSNNPRSLSTTVNPQAGLLGEYISVTAFKDHNNAIWTDTRNGNSDTYGANWVTPLLDVRLVSPLSGATVHYLPTLTWATAWKQNDDHYRLEIATDLQFTNIVYTDVTDTNFMTVTTPLSYFRHYWRVKAFMISSGDSTDYSDPWQFMVGEVTCHDPDEDGFGTPGMPGNECPDDNCPNVYNPGQEDTDNDGAGNACSVCCFGNRGNANGDGDDKANVADVSYLVSWLFGIPSGPDPGCPPEANANGDIEEKVNVSDVSYLVAWLFGIPSGPAPGACP